MPRVHEGKKKRGIFHLSTPFEQSQGGFTFEDDAPQMTAARTNVPPFVQNQQPIVQTTHCETVQQRHAGPALHVAPRKENMDIEVHEYEGGMSQLTLEGGTQFYSGAVDDGVTREWNTMDENNGSSDQGVDATKETAEKKDVTQKQDKQNKMNDGLEDDSVTTIGDNANDEGSIDLLQEDSPADDSKPKSLQEDLAAARGGLPTVNNRYTPSKNKLKIPPELSPATQTLDRLDAFGSQRGGAELSLNLLKWANDTKNAKKADGGIGDEKSVQDSPEKTVIGTQVETTRDGNGGVSFRLLSEAAERKHAVDSSELLAIAHGVPKKDETGSQVQKNVEQQFIPPRPQRDRQTPTQFVARPSKQGLSVEAGDKAHLQGGNPKIGTTAPKADNDSNSSTKDSINNKPNNTSKAPLQDSYAKQVQSISADLAKRQCLHELKEYFMSTQNSSEYARKHQHSDDHPAPPKVPFCIACKNSATQLPHHGLCPKHADFFNSGSYEILNLLVDGNILKCEACSFHFDNGRPNKQLQHIDGCEKGRKKKTGAKNASNGSQKNISTAQSSSWSDRFSASLEEAAASGCKKCQDELATGTKKNSSLHDECCPRKQKRAPKSETRRTFHFHSVSLEDAAATGCKKCKRELATGKKDTKSHDDSCPRKQQRRGPNATLKMAAASGCKKCQREFATGLTSSFSHSKSCPLNDETCNDEESINGDGKSAKFDVGTLVFVEARTWPGMNKLGGVARVTKVHMPTRNSTLDSVKYDVAYVIETRREKMVDEQYVSLHTAYVSPSKDQSLACPTEDLDSSDSEDEQSNHKAKEKQPSRLDSTPARNDSGKSVAQPSNDVDAVVLTSAEKKDEDGNPLSDCELCCLI